MFAAAELMAANTLPPPLGVAAAAVVVPSASWPIIFFDSVLDRTWLPLGRFRSSGPRSPTHVQPPRQLSVPLAFCPGVSEPPKNDGNDGRQLRRSASHVGVGIDGHVNVGKSGHEKDGKLGHSQPGKSGHDHSGSDGQLNAGSDGHDHVGNFASASAGSSGHDQAGRAGHDQAL